MIFPAAARAQNSAPVGELYPADNGAPLQTLQVGTGMPVVAGSELSAGAAPARFRLNRGGQMRLCPRSNLTVNSGTFGLMFTMTAGAMELDYRLAPRGSDILLTPDFSLQLTGPGVYHFAIGVDKTGNTCFKSLPGNVSQVVLSELLGTATYRPKPGDALTFEGGKLASVSPLAGNCGCPPAGPVMVAAGPLPEALKTVSANGAAPASGSATAAASPGNSQLPPDQPGQVHVEVDTPFVFSARGAKPYSVAKINFATLPNVLFLQEKVDPVVLVQKPAEVSPAEKNEPVATVRAPGQKKENKGFFGKLKGFFGSIFHR
ncbi:MAG TPA: hypothetical protein VFL42_10340 [Terriglobales bacterium]|nr:hypothetical protein [Terriglobales bacterium]